MKNIREQVLELVEAIAAEEKSILDDVYALQDKKCELAKFEFVKKEDLLKLCKRRTGPYGTDEKRTFAVYDLPEFQQMESEVRGFEKKLKMRRIEITRLKNTFEALVTFYGDISTEESTDGPAEQFKEK